jgi:hypothetical protein
MGTILPGDCLGMIEFSTANQATFARWTRPAPTWCDALLLCANNVRLLADGLMLLRQSLEFAQKYIWHG